jgi:hypothetical protein
MLKLYSNRYNTVLCNYNEQVGVLFILMSHIFIIYKCVKHKIGKTNQNNYHRHTLILKWTPEDLGGLFFPPVKDTERY